MVVNERTSLRVRERLVVERMVVVVGGKFFEI